MQASDFLRTRSFGDMRSTTYLTMVGNNASSRASLHPDLQLPKDLWWAHSPGCPPPIKNLGRRSARPIEGNKSLGPRKELLFCVGFKQTSQVIASDQSSISLVTVEYCADVMNHNSWSPYSEQVLEKKFSQTKPCGRDTGIFRPFFCFSWQRHLATFFTTNSAIFPKSYLCLQRSDAAP